MVLYTIQHEDMYNCALELGYLKSNNEYKAFPKEYEWMYNQYVNRCNIDNNDIDKDKDLVWCWGSKPDLRRSGYHERGTNLVLLELDIDDNRVLASDFDAWHYVLNNWCIALNEEEFKYHNDLKETSLCKYNELKEKSWEIIFNTELLKSSDYVTGGNQILQYVTGRVPLDKVKLIRHFICK